MNGSGRFYNRINENDINISNALDQIPLKGQITKTHYDDYIKNFKKTFSGNFIGTSSRLLAMKRPDTFVCVDSKNRVKLCKKFGITQSGMDYERYWTDIIERIFDSDWWLNPKPLRKREELIRESRAAFRDSLYYEP